jgi:hypothetical protein
VPRETEQPIGVIAEKGVEMNDRTLYYSIDPTKM